MTEYSRPATFEDLKTLLRSFHEHGVEYLLVGGYALAAHGYPRATVDIDVVVPASIQAGRKVKAALMVLPDQAAKDLEVEWFEAGDNIRVADAFVVDLLLTANGQTYETLNRYAEVIDVDGIPVRTITLDGLLLTKQTLREKDAPDRLVIERALSLLRGSAEQDDQPKNH